jgi:hypothetical protein
MDFSKKVRFRLEPLDPREVPAQLVALPYPAAPEAAVALTAPADVGPGAGASLKIDASLNFSKVVLDAVKIDPQSLVSLKYDPVAGAGLKLDASQGADTGFESLSLNFSKVEFARLKIDSTAGAGLKLDPGQVTAQVKLGDILVSSY